MQRLAIITGAGSGLGRSFCRALIAAPGDWHIVLVDVDGSGARDTLSSLAERGSFSGQCEQFDVSDADAWIVLRDRLRGDWQRLDLLVNNAGVCMSAEVGDGDAAAWRRVFDVNFHGVLCGCQAMVPWLKQSAADSVAQSPVRSLGASRSRPAVVNVASIMGLLPAPALGAYCASKAAVIALSETMYAELQPHGVSVTVAAPGFFASSLLERAAFAAPQHREQADAMVRSSKIDADAVAKYALRASERGELYAVVGRRARWYWRLKRLAPRSLLNSLAHRYQQTMGDSANVDGPSD